MIILSTVMVFELALASVWSFLWTKLYWGSIYKVRRGNLRGLTYGLFLMPLIFLPMYFLTGSLHALEEINHASRIFHQIAFVFIILLWILPLGFFTYLSRKEEPKK
jgi:hypothetical protein